MIHVHRLEEPRILREKKAEWTAKFVSGGKARPHSGTYNHPEVTGTLRAMSHDKCFYCENKGTGLSVDHYVEIAEKRELAFDWANLYLACDICQEKATNTSIPVSDCVNPCDAAIDPAEHIAFESDLATFKSSRGEWTVKKYRLNHAEQVSERRRQLVLFLKMVVQFQERQLQEKRDQLTEAERQELCRFARSDQPFSLMFRSYPQIARLLASTPAT